MFSIDENYDNFINSNDLNKIVLRIVSNVTSSRFDHDSMIRQVDGGIMDALRKVGTMCPKCYTAKKNWDNRDKPSITVHLKGQSETLLNEISQDSSFFFDFDKLPRFCVYLLLKHNHVIYVGKSTNILDRISTHKADKDFSRVILFSCLDGQAMNQKESELIALFNPELNVQKPNYSNDTRIST